LVDLADHELLLVPTGPSSAVAVLVLRRLQEAHRGIDPAFQRSVEVGDVVLVVGLVGLPMASGDDGGRCFGLLVDL